MHLNATLFSYIFVSSRTHTNSDLRNLGLFTPQYPFQTYRFFEPFALSISKSRDPWIYTSLN